jgi:hypothetical protein
VTNESSPREGLVTVLVADDPTQQALAESALREHEVPFVTKNDPIQHMLGAGQIGGFNLVAGPPTIQVAAAHEQAARQALEDLNAGDSSQLTPRGLGPDEAGDLYSTHEATAIRYARYSAVWSVLYLWGAGSVLAVYFGARALRSYRLLPTRSRVLAAAGLTLGCAGMAVALLAYLG